MTLSQGGRQLRVTHAPGWAPVTRTVNTVTTMTTICSSQASRHRPASHWSCSDKGLVPCFPRTTELEGHPCQRVSPCPA